MTEPKRAKASTFVLVNADPSAIDELVRLGATVIGDRL